MAESNPRFQKWLGPYPRNASTKTWWLCSKGHKVHAAYASLRKGNGCATCWKEREKTEADYHNLCAQRDDLAAWTGDVLPKDTSHRTTWLCVNGHTFTARYSDIRYGVGCKECVHDSFRHGPDKYRAAAKKSNNLVEWLGPLPKTVFERTWWLCSNGHKTDIALQDVRKGRGCRHCSASSGEQAIANALTSWGVRFETERRFRKCVGLGNGMLPFDVYIPKWKVLIEYQGRQHYQPVPIFDGEDGLKNRQRHDEIKRKFATSNGFHLIEVSYQVDNVPKYLGIQLAKATGMPYADIVKNKKPGTIEQPEQLSLFGWVKSLIF